MYAQKPQSPRVWFRHLFSAKSALDGGVVRRKVRDMETVVGREQFLQEIARRGFTAVEQGDQVIVFCNSAPLRVLTTPTANFRRKFEGKSSARI